MLGNSRWAGRIYGDISGAVLAARPIVYHGAFGTGLFQTLYEPKGSLAAYLPLSMEWMVLAVAAMLATPFSLIAGAAGLVMIEGGRTPFMTAEELQAVGYAVVAYPCASVFTAVKALRKWASHLKFHGTSAGFAGPDTMTLGPSHQGQAPKLTAILTADAGTGKAEREDASGGRGE